MTIGAQKRKLIIIVSLNFEPSNWAMKANYNSLVYRTKSVLKSNKINTCIDTLEKDLNF